MEINKNILSRLQKEAVETKSCYNVEDSIKKLLELADEDKIYKMNINDKILYSYMTEEEMYQTMFGKGKKEVIREKEESKKERAEYEARAKEECEDALKNQFPKWKKVIEQSFPTDIAKKILEEIEQTLKDGDIIRIGTADALVELLKAAKTKPSREVQKLYYKDSDCAENRMLWFSNLLDSYYADVFEDVIIADVKNLLSNRPEEVVDKAILECVNRVRIAKKASQEDLKKQDAKATLMKRMMGPVVDAKRRSKEEKAGNNIESVLDGEKGVQTKESEEGKVD